MIGAESMHQQETQFGEGSRSNTRTVSEVAALLDLTPRTLKYYEELGLVEPGRTGAGYRLYTEADVYRLQLIKRMRAIGLSLAAIREALRYESEFDRGGVRGLPPDALHSLRDSLQDSRSVLRGRIERLHADLREAEEMVRLLDLDIDYVERRIRGESVENILNERKRLRKGDNRDWK